MTQRAPVGPTMVDPAVIHRALWKFHAAGIGATAATPPPPTHRATAPALQAIKIPPFPQAHAAAGPDPGRTATGPGADATGGGATPEPDTAADPDAPGRRDGLIPAPPGDGTIGPLNVYGMALGTAGIAGYGIFSHMMKGSGIPGGTMAKIIIPSAAAALVGARLYHVATQWQDYRDRPGDIPKMWEGGMAIYGGIAAGTLVGAALARRAGIRVSPLLDAAAIALPIAQAIGRSGNYANQELFGRPTDLPWGLQVDPKYRPAGMEDRNSFHPTFAYEAAWNVALAGGLYGVSKLWKGRPPGALFALYAGGYGLGRFIVEGIRVDPSKEVAGLRTNQWTSLGIMGASAGALALMVMSRGRIRA